MAIETIHKRQPGSGDLDRLERYRMRIMQSAQARFLVARSW